MSEETPYAAAAFVRYSYWALHRVLDALAGATDTELDHEAAPGMQPIRETLRHMLEFEQLFLAAIGAKIPDGTDPTSLTEIVDEWRQVEVGANEFASSVEAHDLHGRIDVPWLSFRPTTEQVLQQFVTHQGQHRSELAAQSTALGRSPGELD
ncbi:MAG TPA: DinB family protein [Dehalococcoidia bacterium]|nr:DinB family protein [Dehalococcoidia bacterium]